MEKYNVASKCKLLLPLTTSAESTLKQTWTSHRFRRISKWPSIASFKWLVQNVLAMLLAQLPSRSHLFVPLFFSTKENSPSWCSLELQSCGVGEGRQYRVAIYWNDGIDTKVCEIFPLLLPQTC